MTPPLRNLSNNLKIPSLGAGTGKLKGDLGVRAIRDAIDAGYRLFDTAFLYGNEDIVGQAISEKIAEGSVKRDEIFIVGKLWGIHHDRVEDACRDSCKRLGVDYVDLFLLHFPVSFAYRGDDEKWPGAGDVLDKDYMDVWREMEKLVDLGIAKTIGVSNFNATQIRRLCSEAQKKPACHEMEFHPAFARHDLVNLCRELDIVVLGYCPLGRHKSEKQEPKFLYDSRVAEIAQKYGKTPAQVVLRFSVQHGVIPIPKSATKIRIQENIEVFDFELTDDDIEFLRTFHDEKNQICKFHFAENSKHYPFI